MIQTESLTRIYYTRKRLSLFRSEWEEKVAVRELSLQIPEGRITGLLGVNGAGKTTTIKMLSTMLLPSAGRGTVAGMDLVKDAHRIRPLVNVIAGGERALYWRLTGRENLWYFGQLYQIEQRELKGRIDSLLAQVGLTEAADTPVERYSKGMKQRLQIARGLINQPRYLFMDEPTLGLDAPIARQLRKMTRDLAEQQGCAVLLTSHYMFEVEELCDYIYVVNRGRLIGEGAPRQIAAMVTGEKGARVVVAGEATAAELEGAVRMGLPGVQTVTAAVGEQGLTVTVKAKADLTAPLVELLSRRGMRILRAESLEPSLEDAIVALAEQQGVVA
ncbi:MAG: ABC transporter ATP-binding protein [Bacillota bacterium]